MPSQTLDCTEVDVWNRSSGSPEQMPTLLVSELNLLEGFDSEDRILLINLSRKIVLSALRSVALLFVSHCGY